LASAALSGYDARLFPSRIVFMRPDKEKVIDEVFDDERIRSFLDKAPMGNEPDVDFSALLYAYRSMRPGDFARFVELFLDAGRNLQARSRDQQTLADIIREHRHGEPFLDILKQHGAA
jgi:hypothetical protein